MSTLILAPSVDINSNPIRYCAIAVSLFFHGLIFAGYGGQPSAISEQPNPSVTRLSFLAPAPEPIVTPEVIPEPIAEKPKVESVRKPERKVVKRKKARKKVVEPVREAVQEQVAVPPSVAAVAQAPAVAAAVKPQVDEGLIKRETERYLSEVMAHIEQYKWYPKAARRRGVEGEVNVRFVLFPDGSARQLVVENGSSVLMAAARQAVEKATPMPKPPAMIHCPLECEFRMSFNLKTS